MLTFSENIKSIYTNNFTCFVASVTKYAFYQMCVFDFILQYYIGDQINVESIKFLAV